VSLIHLNRLLVTKLQPLAILLAAAFSVIAIEVSAQQVRKTNLPAVYINTFSGQSITSKTEYVYATVWMVDTNDSVTRYDSVQIRGRGNSTWNMAKKPYRIKLNAKAKLLGKGHAKAKSWTLLANAGDKTLMRNAVTSELGAFMGLPFNPSAYFCDLILNNVYMGNYQISDQMEVRKKRVEVIEQDLPLTDESDITGGYLLEVDGSYDGVIFKTNSQGVPIRIHYPDESDIVQRQTDYISSYINQFETALFSSDYADAEKGYRPFVDSVTLANWYVATEVSANIDGLYSTYFYKEQQDPRLYWGPLWDYDVAYGNDTRKGDTSQQLMADVGYGETRLWINRMWNDPWFARLIYNRYKQAVDSGLTDFMLAKVDSLNSLLQQSQQLNYQKWGISTRMYNERVLYSSYSQYVDDLKSFITTHNAYLLTTFASKKPAEPTPAFSPDSCYYRIVNAGNAKAFDIYNATAIDYSSDNLPEVGSLVCSWTNSDDRLSEDWQITPVGKYFFIQNRLGGVALYDATADPSTATTNIGEQLSVVDADSTDDRQLWSIVPQGTAGYYNLTNLHTQHTANLSQGSSVNGARVLSYTNDSRNSTSNNRLWYLVPSSALPVETDGINEISREPQEYALAYNPQSQILHFGAECPEQLTFTARVYALSGELLCTFPANEICNVASLPSATYVVSWTVGGKQRSAKFAK
jgi:hypothetical protein